MLCYLIHVTYTVWGMVWTIFKTDALKLFPFLETEKMCRHTPHTLVRSLTQSHTSFRFINFKDCYFAVCLIRWVFRGALTHTYIQICQRKQYDATNGYYGWPSWYTVQRPFDITTNTQTHTSRFKKKPHTARPCERAWIKRSQGARGPEGVGGPSLWESTLLIAMLELSYKRKFVLTQ